ncbi:PREDICTED: 3-ketodihydrosphingosine reductase-like [Amphimedon queenslandica]|uniref:3-dehydrosphinganine reductase n=1 Tax=Amphimedon queenslandica TaxID=400682 RepID=A0A1X7UXY8_AMPQE|nr:PREDICTED: 3-ketodihydrosphingosine reductase-like [Amphimedon queenslandica]|eukprot:XP_003386428.1 PREDICTED: 3-ketodihydrosphingosine reductase-like [Amphimedon queenslandica]
MECCLTVLGFIAGLIAVSLVVSYLNSMRKKHSIKGKHLLITGGSSGIGKSIAIESLKRGADSVTLLARNKDKLKLVKEELEKQFTNKSINILSVDVGHSDAENVIKKLLKDMPPVDVLINSAGITHTASLTNTDRKMFESLYATNVLGSVAVTRAILPAMKDRKSGHIVFISSQAGQFPVYGYTAYSATKFALRGLAEVLAMELRPHKIRVSISFPPDTDTPQLDEELKQRSGLVKELASYSQTIKPEQVASEVVSGIERGAFGIYHTFDGFMLNTMTSGAAPFSSLWELFVQVMLMGLFRLVAVCYLFQFNRIVKRNLKKNN